MFTIIWHCLFIFVRVNDLLFIIRNKGRMLIGDNSVVVLSGSAVFCMGRIVGTSAYQLRIRCCVLERCCSLNGSFPSRSKVLSNNYIVYNDCTYKQIHGCAMGSPVSPVVANLCMEVIEDSALINFMVPTKN